MTGLNNLDPKIRRQYEGLYGPFCSADYQIGEQVRTRNVQGVVIWSFRKSGTGPVTLVIDSGGWPVEIRANEVQS